jgi:hypothetical protein
MTTAQETDPAARDARWVRQSFRTFAVALLLAGIGVLPWVAYSFLPSPGDDGELERRTWAWLFYVSGVPLLLISGVFYVTSLVYGVRVMRRRPVVWSWFTASLIVLVAWGVFALMFLGDPEDVSPRRMRRSQRLPALRETSTMSRIENEPGA